MIEDDEVRRSGSHRAFELLQLAAADQGGRIGLLAALQDFAGNAGSGAGDEVSQLGHGFFRRELTALVVQGGQSSRRRDLACHASGAWDLSRQLLS